jgi:CRISPR/Cas system-associated exonuclease Cas4 (RecB family)
MTLSYSGLKSYENCPRQYHEVRVLKLHPPQDTEQTRWGKVVHEAAELYVREAKPIEIEFPGLDMVEAVAKLKGTKYCELEMAVNDRLESVAFDDPTAILRGIADVVVINDNKARVLDYKTGSAKYPDVAQLELMALMVFAKFPEVQVSHGALLFLAHNQMTQKITKREDSKELWSKWFGKLARVEASHETNVWNAKSSGLCPWCPVTTCEHWKPKPPGR